jgi:methyl coenzyme M reductase gamma subunit
MISVKGIYDGNNVQLLGERPTTKRYKVVVTFLEELDESEDIRTFSSRTEGLHFWSDDREDLYQDFLPKK